MNYMMEQEEFISPDNFNKFPAILQQQKLILKQCQHHVFSAQVIYETINRLMPENNGQQNAQFTSFKIRQFLLQPQQIDRLQQMKMNLYQGINKININDMMISLNRQYHQHKYSCLINNCLQCKNQSSKGLLQQIYVNNYNLKRYLRNSQFQTIKLDLVKQYQTNEKNKQHYPITMNLFFIKQMFVDPDIPFYQLDYKSNHLHLALCQKSYFLFGKNEKQLQHQLGSLSLSISLEDVSQGSLGTCYLLAPMASLAEHFPQIILSRFVLFKNEDHIYPITLFIDGKWEIILCDTAFFVDEKGHFYGAQMLRTKKIWPMLLEKAYAKRIGSYKKIQGNNAKNGVEILTGARSHTYFFNKLQPEDDEMKIIEKIENNNKIITMIKQGCIVHCRKDIEYQQYKGLLHNHSYCLLKIIPNIRIYEDKIGTLYKLYDPLHKYLWKGDKNLNDRKWTEQERDKLKITFGYSKGIFFMFEEHFITQFSQVQVSKINSKNTNSYLDLDSKKNVCTCVKLKINKTGSYSFTTNLIDSHIKIDKQKQRCCGMQLFQHQYGQIYRSKCSDKAMNINVTIQCDEELEVGEYFILLMVDWNHQEEEKYRLSSYGPQQVDMNIVQEFNPANVKVFKTI